ncbi:unnamed protein product [Spodoptera littoralis]|uniref:Gloverin n=1 Tax=Spodoptera littoralis TaxID=7109 RepID=A0A9P0I844_SPOLI|nr:unnamed protein product [Spodoptera littoralis]CAH1641757.1 unnamed protein product [Spodoptera littoralis]
MQAAIVLCFAALLACTYAMVYIPPGYLETHPDFNPYSKSVRQPRDLTWHRNAGRGQIFGTLGSTDDSLFGRGGYKQDIFNDHRGHLQGQAYGSRVLGANGDSTNLGGQLHWSNDNARAALDVHKQIGGGSGMSLNGDGVWKLDKNTRFVTGGSFQKEFGHHKPDVQIHGAIEHDF